METTAMKQDETAQAPGSTTRGSQETRRFIPSVSFVLLALAIIAAGAGAVTWALARPEPRTVELVIPTPGPVVVHVTGAVENPGMFTLPPGSRVADAIDAAGGLTEESQINLASELRDGQQVIVAPIQPDIASTVGDSEAGQTANILLDLNTATAQQLEQLPNIGPARATAIIDFRDRNGPILFVDDLTAIDGIGPATVDGLRPLVLQP